MKVSPLKQIEHGNASMTIDAINVSFGLEKYPHVDDIINMATRQFANNMVDIMDVVEKMKLMSIDNFSICHSKYNKKYKVHVQYIFQNANQIQSNVRCVEYKKSSSSSTMPSAESTRKLLSLFNESARTASLRRNAIPGSLSISHNNDG